VVLVNHRTASASELVAAAIKNLGRGVVVGEPTAGAASIRTVFDIPKGPLRLPPSRHAASDRDIIQDVIDGKAPAQSPPPPVQPERDRELLGLVLATGRLLASGGAEIEGVGVVADVQPTCPAGERIRPDEDCLLLLAQDVIARAKDPQRSTLLSTAKEIASAPNRPRPTSP
jgi:carboxyl-terminal processing protease